MFENYLLELFIPIFSHFDMCRHRAELNSQTVIVSKMSHHSKLLDQAVGDSLVFQKKKRLRKPCILFEQSLRKVGVSKNSFF